EPSRQTSGRACRLCPAVADVAVAVAVHGVWTFGEIAPDLGGGGEILQRASEGFDGQPAVIAAGADRREGPAPGDMAAARHTAVVLGDVYMHDVSDVAREGADGIGFLDIGVESVVHRLDVRMGDL